MASLMDILRQAGFSGQSLNMAYAIAMAESGGNANAHNGNAGTGDNSYGLFQINMLGGMGPERLKQYGLSSNNDLFDMLTNAKVAYKMSKGGTDWSPWSTYNRGDYKKYLGQSGATVTGGTAKPGMPAATDAPQQAGDILGTGNIGAGLAGGATDPFGSTQGDPTATAKFDPFGDKPATTPGAPKVLASSSFRDKVIAYGMQQLGKPYVWGGNGTAGFDCSSLMQYAFGQAGFNLPRVSYDQLKQGAREAVSSLQPGDLVGFGDGHHVALYLGGGRILEAPHTGANVRVRTLGSNEDAFGIHLALPGDR
jgi:cell wall-associated NlpC family hydrolase